MSAQDTQKPKLWARPATHDDIPWVQKTIYIAIDSLDFYCDEFKAYEKQRMGERFLHALYAYDPYHLLILMHGDDRAGIMTSGPENGNLYLYWSYIYPQYRKSRLAVNSSNFFLKHFHQTGDWHNFITFARPKNHVSMTILKRYGWTHFITIPKYLFGEDYAMFMIESKKTTPEYKNLAMTGRVGHIKNKLSHAFTRTND